MILAGWNPGADHPDPAVLGGDGMATFVRPGQLSAVAIPLRLIREQASCFNRSVLCDARDNKVLCNRPHASCISTKPRPDS